MKTGVVLFLVLLLTTAAGVSNVGNKFTVKFTITFDNCTLEQAAQIERELAAKYKDNDIAISLERKIEKMIPSLMIPSYTPQPHYQYNDSVFILDGKNGWIENGRVFIK